MRPSALAPLALLLSACAAPVPRLALPPAPSPAPSRVVVTDARPDAERQGTSPPLTALVPLVLFTRWKREGPLVSRVDVAPLAGLIEATIERALGGHGTAPLEVQVTVTHLYAARHTRDGKALALVVPVHTDAQIEAPAVASVALRVTLVAGASRATFVVGRAAAVDGPGDEAMQAALDQALDQALGELAFRAAVAAGSLGHGPLAPSPYRTGGAMPEVFVIERVREGRRALDTLFVESRTGQIIRREQGPLPDPSFAEQGVWLLSRRSAEGTWLDDESYRAVVEALSARYDVRFVTDARRARFGGARPPGASPPR